MAVMSYGESVPSWGPFVNFKQTIVCLEAAEYDVCGHLMPDSSILDIQSQQRSHFSLASCTTDFSFVSCSHLHPGICVIVSLV